MEKQKTNCGIDALSNIVDMKKISIRTLLNLAEDNGIELYFYKTSDVNIISFPAILHSEDHFSYVSSASEIPDLNFSGYFITTNKEESTALLYDSKDIKNKILGGTWVSAAAATASLTMGIIQKHKSKKALKELEKNKPAGYTVSPELQGAFNRAESMTGSGFTGQEKAAFEQNIARDQNTAQSNALNQGGGNLSQTIAMGLQGQKLGAESTFAADDASLRRQNIQYADSLMKQIQDQKNLGTEQQLGDYKDKQIAFGQAGKQGMENIYKGIAGIGSTFAPMVSGAFGGDKTTGAGDGTKGADPNFGFQLDGLNEDQARTAYESHQDPKVKARLEELYPFLTS